MVIVDADHTTGRYHRPIEAARAEAEPPIELTMKR